jgi:carboxypeptidase C (cathepsin A)
MTLKLPALLCLHLLWSTSSGPVGWAQQASSTAGLPPEILNAFASTPAQSPSTATAGDETKAQPKEEEKVKEPVLRVGQIQTPAGLIEYESITGVLPLKQETGEEQAHVFFVYYRKKGAGPDRPLTVSFNGGPGSSSVWLHLGLFGPQRVDLGSEGFELGRPYWLIDNPDTLLDSSDIVFVDPVTTGYSRAAKGVSDKTFHGVQEDVESVGRFVRLFMTRYERWSSPLFLAGESYGTTRAALLAFHLQERYGIYPSGVALISAILNFQTARFDVGNDLPYPLFLPTYTALAAFHQRLAPELSQDLPATLAEVEAFAVGEYTLALMRGAALPAEQRAAIASKLARYTGLSEQYVLASDLRINIQRFVKELRRSEELTIGRLDGRYLGSDRDSAGENYEYDPSYAAIYGPYAMLMNDYARRVLGFESDLPYEILTGRVQPWSYQSNQNEYLNAAEDLRAAMSRNRSLKVHVASGLYDLATPYFATQYTFDHLQLPPELSANISHSRYAAGHMMYIKAACLTDLAANLRRFYAAVVAGGRGAGSPVGNSETGGGR